MSESLLDRIMNEPDPEKIIQAYAGDLQEVVLDLQRHVSRAEKRLKTIASGKLNSHGCKVIAEAYFLEATTSAEGS